MARPTVENREAIEQAKKNLLHAANLLQDVLDGNSYQTDIAGELGISSMQHMLSEGFEPYIRSVIIDIDGLGQKLNENMTPEEKILMGTLIPDDPYIFGKDGKLRILPDYDIDAIYDAIEDCLTDKEAKVLRMHCGCDPDTASGHPTLEDMGTAVNVTKERARQILNKAFEKLRNPNVQKKIFAPTFETARVETEEITSALKELRAEYVRAKDEYDELIVKLKAVEAAKTGGAASDTANLQFSGAEDPMAAIAEARIPDNGLSYRANNWLEQAGYKTLLDVYRAGTDKLMKIRGLGAKSVAEIICLFRDRYHLTIPKAKTED